MLRSPKGAGPSPQVSMTLQRIHQVMKRLHDSNHSTPSGSCALRALLIRTTSSDWSWSGKSVRHSGHGIGRSTILNTCSKPMDCSRRVGCLRGENDGRQQADFLPRKDRQFGQQAKSGAVNAAGFGQINHDRVEIHRGEDFLSIVASNAEHRVRRTSPTNLRTKVPSCSANWIPTGTH